MSKHHAQANSKALASHGLDFRNRCGRAWSALMTLLDEAADQNVNRPSMESLRKRNDHFLANGCWDDERR